MNLLSLRHHIAAHLRGLNAPAEIKSVQEINPLENPGPWGLLATVDDGTGGERVFFMEIREAEHMAQFRQDKTHQWTTLGKGRDASEVAWLLDNKMRVHGFRTSEMYAHREDLEKGYILTAEDGYEFRVVLEGRENAQ